MSVSALATKVVEVVAPAAIVNNGAFTVVDVDTVQLGVKHNFLQIVCHIGATDIAMAALSVSDSDDGTNFTAITAFDFSLTALPSATDDNKFFIFNIDVRNYGRYFRLVATAGAGTAGTFMSAVGILSRSNQTPVTAAQTGAAAIISA